MVAGKSAPIGVVEHWLTPRVLYLSLVLLFFLNLFVWFFWNPVSKPNASPDVIEGLQAERDRLHSLLGGTCTAPELQSYGRGETGPLPAADLGSSSAASKPHDDLVNLLQSAAVVVFHSEGSGSGFFIDPTTVVTNRHVVEGVKGDTVLLGSQAIGTFLKAKIVSVTGGSQVGSADFALIRLEQPPKSIKVLRIARQPLPLQPVVAVGFPGSAIRSDQNQLPAPIYTAGDVSAVQPQPTGVTFIIHTADISPGSSGGALVDRCGAVVGVNTFIRSSDGKAEGRRLFALSADSLRSFLEAHGQRFSSASDCQAGREN